jgi:hypothetical protein
MQDSDANPAQLEHRLQRLLNHRLLLVVTVLFGLLAAAGWGYWFYESVFQGPQRTAELEDKAARQRNSLKSLNRSLDALSGSSQPPPRYESLGNTLPAPLDGIRSVDQISLLADRIGVELSNIQITPGAARAIGELELSVFDVSFKASGALDALADFSRALQEGVIPWLSMDEVQVSIDEKQATLSAKGSLFTLSSRPVGASPPIFLKGGSPAFQSLVTAESYGVVSDVPIFSFSVESLFDGMDSLRSVQIRVSNPEHVPSLHLYAETGDNEVTFPLGSFFESLLEFNDSEQSPGCRPSAGAACPRLFSAAEDRLIPTTSTATSEGRFRLDLSEPFPFYGHQEQRFYLTADIQSLPDSETLISIEIPVDGINFASGKWPPDGHPDPFAADLLLRPGPAEVTERLTAYFGGETPLHLARADRAQNPGNFVLTSTPVYGELLGEFPNLRYRHYGNDLKQDSFTYRTGEGPLRSGASIVILEVTQPVTINGPTSGPEGATLALTSTLDQSGEARDFTYRWTLSRKGETLASGEEEGFSFILKDQGTYKIGLEVRDEAGGIRKDNRVITVTKVDPTVQFDLGPLDGPATELTSTLLDPGANATFRYEGGVSKDGKFTILGTEKGLSLMPQGV